MEKKNLLGMTTEELKNFVQELGEKPFRGKQLFKWVNRGITDFEEMTDFSKALRAKLSSAAYVGSLKTLNVQKDTKDGTRKFLFGLEDGNAIESVFMQYKYGNSLCVSSQVGCKMGCLSVNGHKVFRLDESVHKLDLLLAGMAGYVHLCCGIAIYRYSSFTKLVNDVVNKSFVSGDRMGAEDNKVLLSESDPVMLTVSHSVKGGHRLTLASRGNNGQLLGIKPFYLTDINDRAVGEGHISKLLCGGNDIQHASSRNHDLSAVGNALVDDLLNAMNVGREGSDNKTLFFMMLKN